MTASRNKPDLHLFKWFWWGPKKEQSYPLLFKILVSLM